MSGRRDRHRPHRGRNVIKTLKWSLMIVIVLVSGVVFAGSASSEPRIDTMPNCPERWNGAGSFGPGQEGFDTPAEAAEDLRQAIIEGGGRGNGLAVEPLVELDEVTFYFPIVDTPEEDADGLIRIEGAPGGGYLVASVSFCAGTLPQPFLWGLEERTDAQ